jgi:hypothetical protein
MADNQEKGREAAVKGRAHEHIVAGILMKQYQNVSLVDLPLSSYDLIIVLKKNGNGNEEIVRAQVKTVGSSGSVGFTGGTRGGIDRQYISGVKSYVQSTKTSDIVIGIDALENGSFDLYFVPTILIEKLTQKSIAKNKIQALKNNAEILENCKDHVYILNK